MLRISDFGSGEIRQVIPLRRLKLLAGASYRSPCGRPGVGDGAADIEKVDKRRDFSKSWSIGSARSRKRAVGMATVSHLVETRRAHEA